MADLARESHYVPQATLRRWSEDGVSVHAYRLLVSHPSVPEWELHGVRGLTRHRDLYTTFEGDREGDDFERFIGREVEDPGHAAIDKLMAKARMTPGDWHSIAKFVAAQQMRTPLFFIEWVKGLNASIPATLQSVLDEVGRPQPTDVVADRHAAGPDYLQDRLRISIQAVPGDSSVALVQAQFSSSRTAWLRFMRRMLTERSDMFKQHRWRVMKLADNAEWPLTDHPVLTLNYHGPGTYDFGAGWGRTGSDFILPISPQLAVGTQVGSRATGPWQATSAQTVELQRMMVERALRWVIARRPEPWIPAVRRRVVDAEAFATEQDCWRTWHQMHLQSEAEFTERGATQTGPSEPQPSSAGPPPSCSGA